MGEGSGVSVAIVVGLGTIARTHLEVLARRPDVEVVGGVDPAGADQPFPVHRDLDAALGAVPDPDLVVVASPTDTHVDLVTEVLRRTRARVLSEKPLARTARDARALQELLGTGEGERRLAVAHHFAFSPEVEWARTLVRAHPEWATPTRVTSVFNDAYATLPESRLSSYVSSWVDSGPNQLSLLAAFVGSWSLVSHDDERVRALTVLDHDGGRTVLSSSWVAADTSKQTTLEFLAGRVEVRMDHTSMSGLAVVDGVVAEHAGYVGADSRKEAHYVGLYRALLAGDDDERLRLSLAVTIAGLLEQAPLVGSDGTLTWSEITSAP